MWCTSGAFLGLTFATFPFTCYKCTLGCDKKATPMPLACCCWLTSFHCHRGHWSWQDVTISHGGVSAPYVSACLLPHSFLSVARSLPKSHSTVSYDSLFCVRTIAFSFTHNVGIVWLNGMMKKQNLSRNMNRPCLANPQSQLRKDAAVTRGSTHIVAPRL